MVLETPLIAFDERNWSAGWVSASGGTVLTEYVLDGESVLAWSELVSVRSEYRPEMLRFPLRSYVDATLRALESALVGGGLSSEIVHETGDDIVHRWEVRHDAAVGNLHAIERLARGGQGLHILRYETERLDVPASVLSSWVDRLCRAPLILAPPRAAPTRPGAVPAPDEVDDLLARAIEAGETVDAVALATDAIRLAERRHDRARVAAAYMTLGDLLLNVPGPDVLSARRALRAFRAALRLAGPRHASSRTAAYCLQQIGVSLLASGDQEPAPRMAVAAFEGAACVYQETDQPVDSAACAAQAALALLAGAEGETESSVIAALANLEYARTVYGHSDDHAVAHAKVMIAMGDALRLLGDITGHDQSDAALALYGAVHERLGLDPLFLGDPEAPAVLTVATERINGTAIERCGDVTMPSSLSETQSGRFLLYLRPFSGAADLLLENRFAAPNRLAVRYAVEPEFLTVEAALYRVLVPHFLFTSIGGRLDAHGGARLVLLGGGETWRPLVSATIKLSHLIVLVAGPTAGIRWEVKLLRDCGALPRCLFVMLPESPRLDAAALWGEAGSLVREFGITLPDYDPAGALCRLNAEGEAIAISFDHVWSDTLAAELAAAGLMDAAPVVDEDAAATARVDDLFAPYLPAIMAQISGRPDAEH